MTRATLKTFKTLLQDVIILIINITIIYKWLYMYIYLTMFEQNIVHWMNL